MHNYPSYSHTASLVWPMYK